MRGARKLRRRKVSPASGPRSVHSIFLMAEFAETPPCVSQGKKEKYNTRVICTRCNVKFTRRNQKRLADYDVHVLPGVMGNAIMTILCAAQHCRTDQTHQKQEEEHCECTGEKECALRHNSNCDRRGKPRAHSTMNFAMFYIVNKCGTN